MSHTYLVEPSEAILGDVDRVWLYVNYKHDIVISEDEYLLHLKWSVRDSPDKWELIRNTIIKNLQGNSNLYVGM
jgi:deoxyribonuclease-1